MRIRPVTMHDRASLPLVGRQVCQPLGDILLEPDTNL
jgi:hypothetical protein